MEKLLYLVLSILSAPFDLWKQFRRHYWLRKNGFWAEFKQIIGDSIVIYEEFHDGGIEKINIKGFFDRGPYTIYIPVDEIWQETMPEWAKWRKNEIVEKMKMFLPPKKYEYYFEKPEWLREQYRWSDGEFTFRDGQK